MDVVVTLRSCRPGQGSARVVLTRSRCQRTAPHVVGVRIAGPCRGITRGITSALVDGDERLALAATIVPRTQGRRLTRSNDDAYSLVMDVAAGNLDDVAILCEEFGLPVPEPWRP